MLLIGKLGIVDPMAFYALPRPLVDMHLEHFRAESSGAYTPPPPPKK